MKFFALASAMLAGLVCGGAGAAPLTFTDRTAFETALPGGAVILEETFDNDAGHAEVLNFDSGVTSTATPFVAPDFAFQSGHRIALGAFRAGVDVEHADLNAPTSIVWEFPTQIFALGFDFLGANNADLAGVNITINDVDGAVTFLMFDLLGGTAQEDSASGFAGFISAGPISSIEFTGTAFENGLDAFTIDNAAFVTAVPVPAALPLLATAFAGLGLLSMRKKRRA